MDIQYKVTATLDGTPLEQDISESLFGDLVSNHGPFKALAQKIASHIENNKDAMLISQLEAKREKKLSKAQKELVAEVVALMQVSSEADTAEHEPETEQDTKPEKEETSSNKETSNNKESAEEEDDLPFDTDDSEDEQEDSEQTELNDAVDEEYGEEDDDMDSILNELGI